MTDVTGRAVLVTGAGSGIGPLRPVDVARRGAAVALRDAPSLEAVTAAETLGGIASMDHFPGRRRI